MLTHRVAIYVPSTTGVNRPAPPEQVAKWTHAAKTTLARLFGGYTATPGHGGWVSEQHGLVEEPVTVVHSHTDTLHPEAEAKVRGLAREIARDMGQEAVSVEMHGGLHFITPHGS